MEDVPPAPPWTSAYEVLHYKRVLAERSDIDAGARAFLQAYDLGDRSLRALPLLGVRDYAREHGIAYRELAAAGEAFVTRASRVYGPNDASDFTGVSRTLFLACLGDARVAGASYLVRTGGLALGEFQDDERSRAHDLCELDSAIFAVRGETAYVFEPEPDRTRAVDEAFVSLLGPHAEAFGHWLWHQIPRFVAALDLGGLPDMPVLVDRDMPQTHFDALALAIGDRAMPLVRVDRGETIAVGRAWYAATPFYVPYLPVPGDGFGWSFIATPPERWLPIVASLRGAPARGTGRGERVYLARQPSLRRKLVNAPEIEAIAREHGFAIVHPDELSFADQVATVREARYVAGPEGSAMFLNFYRPAGTKLAILDHPFVAQLANYTAPLDAAGIDVTIVTGIVVDPHVYSGFPNFGYTHFADYAVEPAAFDAFLRRWTAR